MLCGPASEEGKGEWYYPSNSAVLFLAILWDLKYGFRLRKIWISTHLMPKWALNPKRCVAPLTHFLCAECCDELIKSGLINQTTLKVYVGYPRSSMKYQEVICLSCTCFAKPGLVEMYDNLSPASVQWYFSSSYQVSPMTRETPKAVLRWEVTVVLGVRIWGRTGAEIGS